jgi:hypothetical protein
MTEAVRRVCFRVTFVSNFVTRPELTLSPEDGLCLPL